MRIAFSWIVTKDNKQNAFRIAIFRPATGNRLVFFFVQIMGQRIFNILMASSGVNEKGSHINEQKHIWRSKDVKGIISACDK